MPDLSNLLGAVYGDSPPSTGRDAEDEAHVEHEPAAAERTAAPAVPDWADDEHLDAAFAQWKPGPSDDASPVEHAFVKDADDDLPPPLADDLAAALSEALVAASGTTDTADPAPYERTPQRFDFSALDDADDDPTEEAEPPQALAPLHPIAPVGPVAEGPALPDLSKSQIDRDERAETEQVHEFGEVVVGPVVAPDAELAEAPADVHAEPEAEPEPAPWPQPSPAPAPAPQPSITPQRAAAVELAAASRLDPEPLAAAPAPTPEPLAAAPAPTPEPFAAAPEPAPTVATVPTPITTPTALTTPTPVPQAGDGATAPTALPAGTRGWERSDDDILPDKPAKKFFSLSLRRG